MEKTGCGGSESRLGALSDRIGMLSLMREERIQEQGGRVNEPGSTDESAEQGQRHGRGSQSGGCVIKTGLVDVDVDVRAKDRDASQACVLAGVGGFEIGCAVGGWDEMG